MAPIPFAVPSLQRRLHLGDDDDNAAADLRDNLSGLALDPQRSANAQVLGCLHLDACGFPRSGQRLRCNTTNSGDALTAALASEPLLRPFLPIPGKDNGLDIEGITLLPGGNDVLILAGPTMTLTGPCQLYCWRDALRSDAPAAGAPPKITVHTPEPLLWIRDGAPGPGHNKPEGLQLEQIDGHLIAWVAFDNPDPHRRGGTGCCTRLDGFLLPEALG